MKTTKSLLMITVVLAALSFTKVDTPSFMTGTYGICHYEGQTTMIELRLQDDFTFHYIDNTHPDNKIDLKGTWTRSDNTIHLQDYPSTHEIPNKWKIDKNELCLKTRKGFQFTRLCHLEGC